jgi:hypothetical protein
VLLSYNHSSDFCSLECEIVYKNREEEFPPKNEKCVCWICGGNDEEGVLIPCSLVLCPEFVHAKCDERLNGVIPPAGIYFCNEKCKKEFVVLNEVDVKPEDFIEDDYISNIKQEIETNNEDLMNKVVEIPMNLIVSKLNGICDKKPFFVTSIEKLIDEGKVITRKVYFGFIDAVITVLKNSNEPLTASQIRVLNENAPPLNVNRSLKELSSMGIIREKIVVSVNQNVELVYNFAFKDPYLAACELYTSQLHQNKGLIRNLCEPCCQSGRNPDLSILLQSFAKANDSDLFSNKI